MKNYYVKAIKRLRPQAQFSITDSDLNQITWDVLEGDAPTITKIESAIKEIQAEEAAEEAAKVASKTALLERLGITEDEAKLLLS
jgi:hypothetical protein